MKLKTISLVLFSLILGVGCNQRNDNQPQANSDGASKQTKANQQSKPSTSPSGPSRDAVFKNLQVYFINGENRGQNAKYLPLAEAMEKGIARVNETGEVSNLSIENLSDDQYVFVNAGDIVKGGKQGSVSGKQSDCSSEIRESKFGQFLCGSRSLGSTRK